VSGPSLSIRRPPSSSSGKSHSSGMRRSCVERYEAMYSSQRRASADGLAHQDSIARSASGRSGSDSASRAPYQTR
jgi:hypothetical protein